MTQKKKKLVFCTECKWYTSACLMEGIGLSPEYCRSPKNKVTVATYLGYRIKQKWTPEKQNEKCDCRYFEQIEKMETQNE